MGCISSRNVEFPNDVHPNIFTVATVNHRNGAGGSNAIFGQLEVTSTDLILHRRGHDPVLWPLHYVRRYGFENNVFSFESGRRCESGPGIFTFRCRRAQELFFLVQTCIQDQRPDGSIIETPNRRRTSTNTRPHSSAIDYHLSATAFDDAAEDFGSPVFPNVLSSNQYNTNFGNSQLYQSNRYQDAFNRGLNQQLNNATADQQLITMADADRLNSPNLTSRSYNDDAESINQVFMEITPLMSSAQFGRRQIPHRHSSLATGNGDAFSLSRQRRPHSVEVYGNGAAIYYNSRRSFASSPPPDDRATTSDAYYVNVEPSGQNFVENVARTPREFDSKRISTIVGTKPNKLQHKQLNYVLLDVGGGQSPTTPASPQLATFNLPPPCLTVGFLRSRHSSNQSTETGTSGTDVASVASNYAKIDCTKTRALRDTTISRRIMPEADINGHGVTSGQRRTRHDSTATVENAK